MYKTISEYCGKIYSDNISIINTSFNPILSCKRDKSMYETVSVNGPITTEIIAILGSAFSSAFAPTTFCKNDIDSIIINKILHYTGILINEKDTDKYTVYKNVLLSICGEVQITPANNIIAKASKPLTFDGSIKLIVLDDSKYYKEFDDIFDAFEYLDKFNNDFN